MSIYFPKKDYGRQKRKYIGTIENASRVPFGGNTIQPYYIFSSHSNFKEFLNSQIKNLLETNPSCLDSLNGNVLDNLIDSWAECALQDLDFQRVKHNSAIQCLVTMRKSNIENAKALIEVDRKNLEAIEKRIEDDEKLLKK